MSFRPPSLLRGLRVALLAAALLAGGAAAPVVPVAAAAPTLLSQGKLATASSEENAATQAAAAVDGNINTRWSSAFSDPQWLRVDLGARATVNQVVLRWEAAYARAFQLQVSSDGATWTTVYSTAAGAGGTQTIDVTGSGRYVRLNATARATAYGYSLWEFQVLGAFDTAACTGNDLALNHPASASSSESPGTSASAAVDGNSATRWSSAFSDPQWLQVDLGGAATVCQVVLNWEAAYASAFQVQVSSDAAAWTTIYSTTTGAGGRQTLNVTGAGRYLRVLGTARATPYGYSLWDLGVFGTGGGGGTPPPDQFWGDTTTIPPALNVLTVKILNRTNGRYPDSQVYWSFNGQVHSIAETPYLDMPAYSAGRMYFYLGSPTGRYYDFIEFTVGPDVFNGNTTRVDAFGLKLAMRLHAHDGYDVQVGEDQATFAEDRSVTFQKFVDAAPPEFDVLAQTQAPYRIIAPGSDPSFRAGGVNANYFTAYANSVGVNEPTSNIFGCAGSLAGNPDMCAALNRHTAHLPPAQWQDPARYYLAAPANYYAKFWHDHAIDRLSYGFPYDDVAGQSSFVSHGNPQYLLVAVGW
jgi:hypothetical protein